MRLCCLIAAIFSIALSMAEEVKPFLATATTRNGFTNREIKVDAPVTTIVQAQPAYTEKSEALPPVRHEPVSPKPGKPVLVTARLAPGTIKAVLKLQAVAPGQYVRKSDPAYEKEWIELPMRDDGEEGDAKAGDGVFSARVPAAYQRHRWLLRYRIVATDRDGKTIQLPSAENTCPNFAWWCDAGPAAWTGTREPGKTPNIVFSSDFLGTIGHIMGYMLDAALNTDCQAIR